VPEITLNREDMKSLGATLDQVVQTFDDRERVLLLAIIALAGEALAARAGDEVSGFEGSAPSVSEIVVTKTTDTASPGLFESALGSGSPQESLSLNFTKISFDYHQQ
jgi:type VI protein secretion system component Hcp